MCEAPETEQVCRRQRCAILLQSVALDPLSLAGLVLIGDLGLVFRGLRFCDL